MIVCVQCVFDSSASQKLLLLLLLISIRLSHHFSMQIVSVHHLITISFNDKLVG